MASGKSSGYIIGGLEIVVGALLTIFSLGTLSELGVPLMLSGAATIVGTALAPAPPRQNTLRDSPTYGIDRFDNPRGPEAHVPILYGTHRVKPVVIAESANSLADNAALGVDAQNRQGVKWLSVVAEGVISSLEDIEINDRKVLSDVRTEQIGKGDGTKKDFTFPTSWVYLGTDEAPDVLVYVGGVLKSYAKTSVSGTYPVPKTPTVPATAYFPALLRIVVTGANKGDRILSGSFRVFITGPGRAEFEQLAHVGTYRWNTRKLSRRVVQVWFTSPPPYGYSIRITYDVLSAAGLVIVQSDDGTTKAVFGTAPANKAVITATYRTAQFRGISIDWRPGTLDQQPLAGFNNIEQSHNPNATELNDKMAAAITYSTSGREVDDLRFVITAPRGLIQYKSDGGTDRVVVKLRFAYRKLGTTAWTYLRRPSGTEYSFAAEKPSTIRWEIDIRTEWETLIASGDDDAEAKLADFDRAAYELSVIRLTPAAADPLVSDELSWAYVTEVINETLVYPGTCLLAIRALPSAFLSGQSLRVSCLATRAPLYDPRPAGGSRDIGSSQNAALAIRDLVTSSEGVASERFGGGFFFSGSDFFTGAGGDLNGWTAFADFCDAWVHRPGDDPTIPASATNGERRCRLNVVLDTPMSLMETVGDFAFLAYCFATLQGAKWRFPLDQDGASVFTFVDDVDPPNQNLSKFVLKMEPWGNSPSGIKGSFWNERIDYERDEFFHPVTDLTPGTATNVKSVDLRGCTRETEAARLLRHLAEQAREMPYPCAWQAHPGVQHVEAGDIVTVRTRVPYSTGASAMELKVRVLAGMVGRGEDGKLTVRYTGRVMASSAYQLQAVTVPVTTSSTAVSAAEQARQVTGLSSRVI